MFLSRLARQRLNAALGTLVGEHFVGASITVHWPGITEADEADQPDFMQDCHAYADLMTTVVSGWFIAWGLRRRGLGALLSFYSSESPDSSISWTTPAALEAAAESLRFSLTAKVPFALRLAERYRHGPGVEPQHVELAADLADVASIAQYARARGARQVTLLVGW